MPGSLDHHAFFAFAVTVEKEAVPDGPSAERSVLTKQPYLAKLSTQTPGKRHQTIHFTKHERDWSLNH